MNLDIRAFIVVATLTAWLLVSGLVYIPKLRPVIRRADQFSLIPEWRFFAPRPGQHDFTLLYRDQYVDGYSSPWIEIRTEGSSRWRRALWNPKKRAAKALFDCTHELGKQSASPTCAKEIGHAYLTLLNHVQSVQRLDHPQSVQFVIFATEGGTPDAEPTVAYLSSVHRFS